MKNTGLIIKAAVSVSAIASLFSIVTLIRAIIIKANIVLPIIQVVGSLAIFAVCILIFRALSKAAAEDEGEDESKDDTRSDSDENTSDKKSRKSLRQKDSDETDAAQDEESPSDQAEKEADELYEKYHLSEFENKKDEE